MSTRQLLASYCDLSWKTRDTIKVFAGISVGLVLLFMFFTAADYYVAWAEWSSVSY